MTYIWTTKDGKQLNVDEITDVNHLRNIVKMLIRNAQPKKERFKLNGDMANFFNDSMEDHDHYLNEMDGL